MLAKHADLGQVAQVGRVGRSVRLSWPNDSRKCSSFIVHQPIRTAARSLLVLALLTAGPSHLAADVGTSDTLGHVHGWMFASVPQSALQGVSGCVPPQTAFAPSAPKAVCGSCVLAQRVLIGRAEHLHFMTVDQFVRVFFNNQEIYHFGAPERPQTLTAGNTMHVAALPQNAASGEICFRIFSQTAQKALKGQVLLGARADILAFIVRRDAPALAVGLLVLLAGFLLLYASSITALPGLRSFAAYAICVSLWSIAQTEAKQVFIDDWRFWRALDLGALFGLAPTLLVFFSTMVGRRVLSRGLNGLATLHSMYGLVAIGLVFGQIVRPGSVLFPYQIAIALELVALFAASAQKALRGHWEARVFFGGLAVSCLLGLHDVAIAFALIHSVPLVQMSVAIVIASMTLILVRRYLVESNREKDEKITQTGTVVSPLELALHYSLTPQELRICIAVLEGRRRPEIARQLRITNGTLKVHLKSIYSKTLDRDSDGPVKEREKLHRLSLLLMKVTGSRPSMPPPGEAHDLSSGSLLRDGH